MNGTPTKYTKAESRGSGSILIPIKIAKALNWADGDEINLIFETKEDQKGLFVYKKK